MLLYEVKLLVPNYSCLQNHWLGATAPRFPLSLSSVLNWIFWTPPPQQNSLVRHWLWRNVSADVGFTGDTDTVLGETVKDALSSVQYVNPLLAVSRVIHPETVFCSSGRCHPDGRLVFVDQCTGRWSRPDRCHPFSTKANLRTSAPRASSKGSDDNLIYFQENVQLKLWERLFVRL